MASTWSALKVELLGTGENSGTWGTLTNANLGDAVLGEAITGSATVDFATNADVTITLTDAATTQSARNLRLNITESSTGVGSVRNLILGSGCQIEKFYLINNTGSGAKTVKNTSGTGISVPAGKATLVYNDGTNVVDGASYFTSLTLGSALPVASGGTGLTAGTSGGVLAYTASGTLASSTALAASALVIGGGAGAAPSTTTTGTGVVTALGVNTGSAGAFVVNGGALGTPSSGTATNLTGLPVSTGISGLGTGVATSLAINVGTAGSPLVNGGALGTPSSGTATNVTGLPLTTGVTGTLPVANGGTGSATLAGANIPVLNVANTFTGLQTFAGTSANADLKTSNILETATVSATAATGTINYDTTTQSVLYFTTNASGNFTVNFRGSSGTSLNTVMSTGESLSATFLVTNGATAYYNSVVQVDGSTVTPKWQGGTAPTSGNASSVDSYTYVIIKTGSAAFTVLASQTKFA